MATAYPALAEAALGQGVVGSSAAGEFPKFTAQRQRADGQTTHVIVKFSGADGSPAVRRWADLLVCEHLALETLVAHLDVPVAHSQIVQHAGRTFLEVERFDRHGAHGRSAVCSLASLNAALLGLAPGAWGRSANALQQKGWLDAAGVEQVALVWWFGQWIANNDMHEGNLSFQPGLKMAPVYDMLPMLYAPLPGGEVPERRFQPVSPLPPEQAVATRARVAAQRFWARCANDQRISPGFRNICQANALALAGTALDRE